MSISPVLAFQEEEKKERWDAGHSPLPPKPRASTFRKVATKSPSSSATHRQLRYACVCVCVCESGGAGAGRGEAERKERESEETGECATMSVWAAERQKWMFACSVSASLRLKSLMNMEQLLLAAASGGGASAHWWGGATLWRGRGNSRRRGWCAVCWNTPTDIAHKQPAFTTDWSKYTWNHTDKTLLFVLSEEETFYYPILVFFVFVLF